MAKKKEKPIKVWNPNSLQDLHNYFINMPQWYYSENYMITDRDFPYVCMELINKFTGIKEEYIYRLVLKYKSRQVLGTYNPDADEDAGSEYDE